MLQLRVLGRNLQGCSLLASGPTPAPWALPTPDQRSWSMARLQPQSFLVSLSSRPQTHTWLYTWKLPALQTLSRLAALSPVQTLPVVGEEGILAALPWAWP